PDSVLAAPIDGEVALETMGLMPRGKIGRIVVVLADYRSAVGIADASEQKPFQSAQRNLEPVAVSLGFLELIPQAQLRTRAHGIRHLVGGEYGQVVQSLVIALQGEIEPSRQLFDPVSGGKKH